MESSKNHLVTSVPFLACTACILRTSTPSRHTWLGLRSSGCWILSSRFSLDQPGQLAHREGGALSFSPLSLRAPPGWQLYTFAGLPQDSTPRPTAREEEESLSASLSWQAGTLQNQPAAWGAAARAFIYTGSSAPHFLLPIWVSLRLQVMALTLSDPKQAERRAMALGSVPGAVAGIPNWERTTAPTALPPAHPQAAPWPSAFAVSLYRSSQAPFPLLLLTALVCLLTSPQTLPLYIFS